MGIRWGISAAVLVAALATLAATARADEILVVVHPQAPVERLSDDQLKQVYLGENSFWGQVKIHPAVLRVPPEIYAGFMGAVAGISPGGYEAFWIRKIFREGGMPPRPFDSAGAILSFVANTPGAVGFIRRADLDGAHVKVAAHFPVDTSLLHH